MVRKGTFNESDSSNDHTSTMNKMNLKSFINNAEIKNIDFCDISKYEL